MHKTRQNVTLIHYYLCSEMPLKQRVIKQNLCRDEGKARSLDFSNGYTTEGVEIECWQYISWIRSGIKKHFHPIRGQLLMLPQLWL